MIRRLLIITGLMISIFGIQSQIIPIMTKIRISNTQKPQFRFSSQALKTISLGHNLLIADLIWLDAVQYIGEHARNLD